MTIKEFKDLIGAREYSYNPDRDMYLFGVSAKDIAGMVCQDHTATVTSDGWENSFTVVNHDPLAWFKETPSLKNSKSGVAVMKGETKLEMLNPKPTKVIFNPPATIVFWSDGTKTVVQTRDDDEFDPEKGLAMAISKKALGNKHEYYHVFKKWLK
jgi:hypothetical protein